MRFLVSFTAAQADGDGSALTLLLSRPKAGMQLEQTSVVESVCLHERGVMLVLDEDLDVPLAHGETFLGRGLGSAGTI